MGCPVARFAQTWPKTFDINENGVILVFWLHVKKRTKSMFFRCGVAPPHPTAKPSWGWLRVGGSKPPLKMPELVTSRKKSYSRFYGLPPGVSSKNITPFRSTGTCNGAFPKAGLAVQWDAPGLVFGTSPGGLRLSYIPSREHGVLYHIPARTERNN